MSSLDGIFTLQPEELFANTTLERISHLSDAEAVALLPKINIFLAQEAAAWTDHCTNVQSKHYTAIISKAHARRVDVESVKAMAIHHVLATMPERFAILAKLNRCELLQPLSETLTVLRDEVSQDRTRGGAAFGASHRRFVYGHAFAAVVSEQEAILTELENLRLDQLRKIRMMLLATDQLAFTSTKHVVAFVSILEELGVKTEDILPGVSAEGA
jgi:hypothetical protein